MNRRNLFIAVPLVLTTVTAKTAEAASKPTTWDAPVDPFSLADCGTIDKGDDPEHTLPTLRMLYGSNPAKFWEGTDGSTKEAVDVLSSFLARGKKNPLIGGHGFPGQIVTGGGTIADDPDRILVLDYLDHWQVLISQLHAYHIKELTLLACWTGGDQEGVDLLYKISSLARTKVRASTGVVGCDDHWVYFEKGSTWQTTAPDSLKPKAIAPPSYEFKFISDSLVLERDGQLTRFSEDDVASIDFFRAEETGPAPQPLFSFPGAEVSKLLRTIQFSSPGRFRGTPLAVITYYMRLNLRVRGTIQGVNFVVYGNRLLRDRDSGVYYKASSGFATILLEKRRRPQ